MAKRPAVPAEPKQGHNSGELTADERRALFMHHYGPIAAQLEKVKEQQAEYKRLRKLAKADGIALRDVDFAMRCAEVEDDSIIPEQIKRQAEIAAWFALPVHFQPDMFDLGREPAVDRAKREGDAAGFNGRANENPYGADSKPGQAWQKAFNDGHARRTEAIASALEKKQEPKGDELIKGAGADPEFPDPVNQNEPAAADAAE